MHAYAWSEKWLLKLNTGKCKISSLARTSPVVYNYVIEIDCVRTMLDKESKMNDLGVQIDENLCSYS